MSDGNGRLGNVDEAGLGSGDLDGLRLEGVIDQALGSYTPREPRAGLESRVLSHIAAAEAERSRHGWSWKPAWALAAAMALLVVVGVPLSYRLGRQETAVARSSEVHQPEVAEVQHAAPAAPLADRHTVTPHRRVAAAEHEEVEVAANTGTVRMEQRMIAPSDDKQPTDEMGTLKPIALKPITIAPIQIAALN
jgi:hypothetical protein